MGTILVSAEYVVTFPFGVEYTQEYYYDEDANSGSIYIRYDITSVSAAMAAVTVTVSENPDVPYWTDVTVDTLNIKEPDWLITDAADQGHEYSAPHKTYKCLMGRRLRAPGGRYNEALWGTKVSPSTISELNKKAYVHIEDWRNRPLQGGRYPYVYVDGIYLRRNWGGEYENVAFLQSVKAKPSSTSKEACECLRSWTRIRFTPLTLQPLTIS